MGALSGQGAVSTVADRPNLEVSLVTAPHQPLVRYRSEHSEPPPAQHLPLPQTATPGHRSILHLNSSATARTLFKGPKPAERQHPK